MGATYCSCRPVVRLLVLPQVVEVVLIGVASRGRAFVIAAMGITLSFPDIVSADPHKGFGMGMGWEHLKEQYKGTKTIPEFEAEPSRDPQLGFEGQRKLREPPKTTLEEMKALKINVMDRHYCVDELADYVKCYHKHSPFLSYNCSHQRHHFHECEYNSYILRMKEYEREWRLNKRAERVAKQKAKMEAMD